MWPNGQMTNNPNLGSNPSAATSSLWGSGAHYLVSLSISGLLGKMRVIIQMTLSLFHYATCPHPNHALLFFISLDSVGLLFNHSLVKPDNSTPSPLANSEQNKRKPSPYPRPATKQPAMERKTNTIVLASFTLNSWHQISNGHSTPLTYIMISFYNLE